MSQNFLQHVDIPAIAQKSDGKGVAKAMGIGISDPGPLAEPANQPAQPVPAERSIRQPHKQRLSFQPVRSGGQITPDDADGSTAQRNSSRLITLANDGYPLVDEVNVGKCGVAQLAGPQAGVQQGQKDRGVKNRRTDHT